MATLKHGKTLRFWIQLSTTELSYKAKCEKINWIGNLLARAHEFGLLNLVL